MSTFASSPLARTLWYILKRAVQAIVVIILIAVALFLVFYMLPANPAQLSCGKPCTPEQLQRVSAFMGTDQPWYAQLGAYMLGIFAGRTFGTGASAVVCSAPCLGYSFRLSTPVTTLIAQRFPVTASIAIGAAVLWMLVGVSTGVLAAVKRGTWVDRLLNALSSIGISSPSYLIGLLAIIVFAIELPLFPSSGYVAFSTNPLEWLQHMLLPWLVLALLNAAG